MAHGLLEESGLDEPSNIVKYPFALGYARVLHSTVKYRNKKALRQEGVNM